MSATTATRWTTWALQYEDRNGVTRQKQFATEKARQTFIDNGVDSGRVSRVFATSDPS